MDLNAAKNQCAVQSDIPARSWQPLEVLALTILGIASLGLIRYTDLFLYRAAMYSLPAAAWIPDVRITSCLITFALYILVQKRCPTHREDLKKKDAYWVALVSAGWLWARLSQFFGFVYTCRPFMASWKPSPFLCSD